ncbi:MAG: dTDP-4-dehydrorhamnose reductase [Winogradskyella sp.]|uniref:dTDP-4-dehydrorhamnose reductase n=1 Tax=Winogradskyella sp. TaxID=1883156 RepID=UPI00385EF77D
MKKVIVIGANGQLGRSVRDVFDDGITFSFYSREELDIIDKENLKQIFKSETFDYCVNCAAYTNVEGAETNLEQAFLINAEGAKNIAEVCQLNAVKLIHISTDYVFNGENRVPYDANDSTNPINVYGESKLQGERYIQDQLNEHYIIRTSWLYSLHGKNFLKTIISKLEDNISLNITTEEEGTPTSCTDLAAFIVHIIKTDKTPFGTYHFSANGSTTWYGFAQEIAKHLNLETTAKIKPTDGFKTLAKRPKYSVLDLKKTEDVYKKLSSWETSVRFMVEAYKG